MTPTDANPARSASAAQRPISVMSVPGTAAGNPIPTRMRRILRAAASRVLNETDYGGPCAGGPTDQVIAFGDVRGAPGGLRVRRGGGGQVAVELVQVAADGMPPVAVAEHLAQPVGLEQPRSGTDHVADRDRAAEHGGGVLARRVLGEGDEVVVPGEDLRPIGLPGARRVVVQGGDGRLDLVAPGAMGGQRRLQD